MHHQKKKVKKNSKGPLYVCYASMNIQLHSIYFPFEKHV